MLHTKLRGNRPAASREEDFEGFLPYMGVVASWSCDQHRVIRFSFSCTQNLVQIGTVVSEKIQFECLYVHDLGPRSRNDLDLQYSHIFIYSIRCLLLLPVRSLAVIVLKNPLLSLFPIEKPKFPKLTLL